jgi:hypothetical protein
MVDGQSSKVKKSAQHRLQSDSGLQFGNRRDNCTITAAIDRIRAKFAHDAFAFSLHATNQTILRGIRVNETGEAIQMGGIYRGFP